MTLAIHPPIYPHATPRKEQRSPTPSFQIEEKIQEIYASCIEQLSQTFTTPQLFPPFQKEHTILEELNYHTMIHPEVLFSTIASQFCTFLHYSQYFVIPIFSHNANFIERGKKYNYHIIIYRTTPYARQYDILIGNSANTIPINSSRIKKIYKGLHCTYSLDPNPRISSFQMIVFQILHNNKLIFDQRLQTSLFHRMVFEIIKTGIAIPSTMIEPLIWIQPYYEKTLTDFVNSILEGDRFPDFVTNINIFSSLLEIMNAHRFFNLHHDDLKPDNLLMRGRASPVINDYDFGFQGSSCIPDPIVAQNPRDYPFWPATRNYGYKTSFTDTYSLFLPILHFLITYDLNYYEYYKQLHKIIHLKNPDRYLALLKLSCITNFSQMFNHHKEKDTQYIPHEILSSDTSKTKREQVEEAICNIRNLLSDELLLMEEEETFYSNLLNFINRIDILFSRIMFPLLTLDQEYYNQIQEHPFTWVPEITDPFETYRQIFLDCFDLR